MITNDNELQAARWFLDVTRVPMIVLACLVAVIFLSIAYGEWKECKR